MLWQGSVNVVHLPGRSCKTLKDLYNDREKIVGRWKIDAPHQDTGQRTANCKAAISATTEIGSFRELLDRRQRCQTWLEREPIR